MSVLTNIFFLNHKHLLSVLYKAMLRNDFLGMSSMLELMRDEN